MWGILDFLTIHLKELDLEDSIKTGQFSKIKLSKGFFLIRVK